MGRATISVILAVMVLASTLARAAVFDDQSVSDQIALIPAGTTIEIRLGDGSTYSGKLVQAADGKLEMEIGRAGHARITQFAVSDIRAVRSSLRGRGDLEVSPGSLGAIVLDEKVTMMMRDGTYVEGKVRQATEERLVVDVSKSEPKGRLHGSSMIPTADIAVVYMKKNGPIAVPVLLGILGGLLGGTAGSYAAYQSDAYGAAGGFMVLGGIAGGATAGAYVGHEAAKKTITINVVLHR
jgi:hypothetical protein